MFSWSYSCWSVSSLFAVPLPFVSIDISESPFVAMPERFVYIVESCNSLPNVPFLSLTAMSSESVALSTPTSLS